MAQLDIDTAAIFALAAPGGDVDDYCHEVADAAYEFSQQLVPQPGRPENPYATGELIASGHVERGPGNGTWDVEYGTDHAIYVEMGTRYMRAEPFLRPALLMAVRR